MTNLQTIRDALASAPPQPWRVRGEARGRLGIVDSDDRTIALVSHVHVNALTMFAAAPTWLAELVERVERAEAALDLAGRVADAVDEEVRHETAMANGYHGRWQKEKSRAEAAEARIRTLEAAHCPDCWSMRMAREAAAIGRAAGLEEAARIVDGLATYEDPGEFCYAQSPSDAIRAAARRAKEKP